MFIVCLVGMILNLGSELITLTDENTSYVFPFKNVEESLTTKLLELYQEKHFTNLYVINGPGSFTNLRVGALVATMMYSLSKGTVELFDISKEELFRYLYLQGILPKQGYIYLGQRKRFGHIDFEQEKKDLFVSKIFSDSNQEIDSKSFVDWFLGDDFPFFTERRNEIGLSFINDRVVLSYQDAKIDCTDVFSSVEKIEPVYGVELDLDH